MLHTDQHGNTYIHMYMTHTNKYTRLYVKGTCELQIDDVSYI